MTESPRSNRRAQIVEAAADLFTKQGYTATSVRQIADVVGCTEAALYYHFREGKRALFGEVVERNLPDMITLLNSLRDAPTLRELVMRFGTGIIRLMAVRADKFRWTIAEFPKLDESERAMFHAKYQGFHDLLTELVGQFIKEPEEARRVAWSLICAHFGYGQLFFGLDVKSVDDFDVAAMTSLLADSLTNYYQID
jgi:AcrR family transcriptional regulator